MVLAVGSPLSAWAVFALEHWVAESAPITSTRSINRRPGGEDRRTMADSMMFGSLELDGKTNQGYREECPIHRAVPSDAPFAGSIGPGLPSVRTRPTFSQ